MMIGAALCKGDRISIEFSDGIYVQFRDANFATEIQKKNNQQTTPYQVQIAEVLIWINRARVAHGTKRSNHELRVLLEDNRALDVGIAPQGALKNIPDMEKIDTVCKWIETHLGLGEIVIQQ